MRKITIYLAVCCLQIAICSQLHAQGVGINTAGNPADNSAILDVSSTNLGILIPRMTTAQMNAISSPATGLIIYNTDCNNLNYNAGTLGSPNWVTINSTVGTPGNITGSASVCANQAGVTYSIAAVSGATSYSWILPTGATITAGTGTSSITVTFGTNGGNVCVSSANSCGTSNASCITVTVYGNLTAGTISSNQTICSGGTPSALIFTTPPTGGTGAYTYQWYNGTGSLGSAATNSTYSPGALTASGIISTESFDGTTFPPTGWGNTVISDPDCPGASSSYCPFAWMRTTGGVWITEDLSIPESPHSGAGEAWYDSWDAAVGDEALLVSPSFTETGNTSGSGATVSFWMFATDEDTHDLVNVWYSTNSTQPTSTSGASLLGTVMQYNAVNGWYQHTYTIPSSVTSSTVWLIFDAVSAFGIEMYIDDVSWTAISPTTPANYYCSVTSGCTAATDTVTVSVNALPPASISPPGATICSENSTIILTASGGGTYLWSTGANTAAITVSRPTSTTTYTVTVTGGAVCNATASATVNSETGILITSMTATEQSGLAFNVRPVNGPNDTVPAGTTYTWSAPTIYPAGDITGGSAQSTGVTYIYGILTNTGTGIPSPAAWAIYSVTPTAAGGCTGPPFTVTDTVLQVGSVYNGGVVGYFLTSGQTNGINNYDPNLTHAHGLIFASTYNAQGVFFFNSSPGLGSSPDGLGTGFGNTATFIAINGTTNPSAPATCYTYGLYPGVWWLPSYTELMDIRPNWALLGGFNTSTCANNEYWASSGWGPNGGCGSDCDASNVSIPMGCGDGGQCCGAPLNVRCVRNF